MQSYDEVTRKYNKYLTGAQKKQLRQRATALSLQNAQSRNELQSQATVQRKQTNRYLSSMGLSSNLRTAPSSGVDDKARRMPAFRQQLQSLAASEQGQLQKTGLQMANATINQRIQEAQKAARSATTYRAIDPDTGTYYKDESGKTVTFADKTRAEQVQSMLNGNYTYNTASRTGTVVTSGGGSGTGVNVAALVAQRNALNAEQNALMSAANLAATSKSLNRAEANNYAAGLYTSALTLQQKAEEVQQKYKTEVDKTYHTALMQASTDGAMSRHQAAMMSHMVRTGKMSYSYASDLIDMAYLNMNTKNAIGSVDYAEKNGLITKEEAETARVKLKAHEEGAFAVTDLISTRYDERVTKQTTDAISQALSSGLISDLTAADYTGRLEGLSGQELVNAANAIFGDINAASEAQQAQYNAVALQEIAAMAEEGVIPQAVAAGYRASLANGTMNAASVVGALNATWMRGVKSDAESAIRTGLDEGILTEDEAAGYREQLAAAGLDGVSETANGIVDTVNERYRDKVQHNAMNTIYGEFYGGDIDAYLDKTYGTDWQMYSLYLNMTADQRSAAKAEAQTAADADTGTTAGEAAEEKLRAIEAAEKEEKRIDYYSMGDTYYEQNYGMNRATFDNLYAMDEDTLEMILNADQRALDVYAAMATVGVSDEQREDAREEEVLSAEERMRADVWAQTQEQMNAGTKEEEGTGSESGEGGKRFGTGRVKTNGGTTAAPVNNKTRTRTVTTRPITEDGQVRNANGLTEEGESDRAAKEAEIANIRTVLAIKRTEATEQESRDDTAQMTETFKDFYTHEYWTPERLNTEADRLAKEERTMRAHLGELRERATTDKAAMAEYKELERSVQVIGARRAGLEAKLAEAPTEQAERWNAVTGEADYASLTAQGLRMAQESGASELTRIVNGIETETKTWMAALTPSVKKSLEETVSLMTDEEKQTYNYYLARDGEDGAKAYYDAISPLLDERRMDKVKDAANADWTGSGLADGVLKSAVRVASTAVNWLGELGYIGLRMSGSSVNANSGVFALDVFRDELASSTKQTIYDGIMGDTEVYDTDYKKRARLAQIASFGYDCTLSCAENLVTRAIGMNMVGGAANTAAGAEKLGELFTLFTMSCSSALSTERKYIELGASQNQAMAIGVCAGICESLFEKVSLENLINMPQQQMKSWIAQTMLQAGIEGSEEGATELANLFCSALVFGNRNDYRRAVEAKKANHMSEAAAESEAFIEQLEDIGMAMAGGAFSGALMGGVESWKNRIQIARTGAALNTNARVKSLLEEAENITNKDAERIRFRVANAIQTKGAASNLDVGMLNYAVSIGGLESTDAVIDTMVDEGQIGYAEAQEIKAAYEKDALTIAYGGEAGLADTWDGIDAETLGKVAARINAENKMSGREYGEFFAEKKRAATVNAADLKALSNRINAKNGTQTQTEQAAETKTAPFAPLRSAENAVAYNRTQSTAAFSREPAPASVRTSTVNNDPVTAGVVRRYDDKAGVAVNLHAYRSLSQLNARENLMLRFAQAISRATGLDIEVHDRLNSENGYYRGEDGTLHIALNAESFSGTMAHELTHFIKAKCTAEEWAAFSKYFKENTIGYERLVNQKRQEYAAEIGNRSEQAARAYAEEEAVASMCEGMLNDEAKVYEFCRANETLGQRILAVLDSVLRNFKQLLRGEREGSEVWRLGSDLEKVRETRDLWYEMLQKATDAQKAGAESTGETKYSLLYTRNMTWKEQVSQYKNGKFKSSDAFDLGKSGDLYAQLGMADLDIGMYQRNYKKSVREKEAGRSRSAHGLGDTLIEKLQHEIMHPVAIFDNPNDNCVYAVTNIKKNGFPVVATIKKNVDIGFVKAHELVSMYEMRDFLNYADEHIPTGSKVLITNRNKLADLLLGRGIQYSKLIENLQAYDVILAEEESSVKHETMKSKKSGMEQENEEETQSSQTQTTRQMTEEEANEQAAYLDEMDRAAEQRALEAEAAERSEPTVTADDEAGQKAFWESLGATYADAQAAAEARTDELYGKQEAREERVNSTAAKEHKSIFGLDRQNKALAFAQKETTRKPVLDENGKETGRDASEAVRKIVPELHAVPNFGLKDPAKMLDALAGKNREVRSILKDIIERPFNEAGGKYATQLKERREAFDSKMKELGIIGDSKKRADIKRYRANSALVQAYGEGEISLKELQEMRPDWQNIVEAAKVCRDIYDDYVVEQNSMLEKIYPNLIDHWETREDKLQGYVDYELERAANQREYIKSVQKNIADLEEKLAEAEAGKAGSATEGPTAAVNGLREQLQQESGKLIMLDVLLDKETPGTKAWRQLDARKRRAQTNVNILEQRMMAAEGMRNDATGLKNRIAFEQQKLETAQYMLEQYEQKAALRALQKAEIQAGVANGELVRNRKVLKRNDYFHHFLEDENSSSVKGLKNILFGPSSEISPNLVGKTQMTKPKTKWAGFMQSRNGGNYTLDAVEGMHRYMEEAERKLAFDPFTAHLSEIEKQVTEEQQANGMTNGNDMERWLQEWRNAIVGKSNRIDRAVFDGGISGRKFIQTLKWVNNRVKGSRVLGNLHSAAVQVSNITNATSYIQDVKAWASAARQLIQYKFGDAQAKDMVGSAMAQSAFLAQRYGMEFENYNETWSPKQMALWMLGAGDELAGKFMWLGAYNAYLNDPSVGNKVGSGQYRNAAEFADDITRRSTAGRGIGEQPTMLTSQIVNTLAPFQLEVNNSWQLFKDNVKKGNATGLATFEIVTALMNTAFEAAFGDRPLPFDFIDAVVSAVKGANEPDDDDEDEQEANVLTQILKNCAGTLASSIPFSGLICEKLLGSDLSEEWFGDNSPTLYGTSMMGAGTLVETVSQIRDFVDSVTSGKVDSADELWTKLLDDSEFLNLLLPWGGAQAQRTLKGLDAAARGYSQKMNSDGALEAQFGIERSWWKTLQAAAFGKWSTAEGKAYLAGETSKLTAEQTSAMKQSGMEPTRFFDKLAELKGIQAEKDAEGNTTVNAVTLKLRNLYEDKSMSGAQKDLMLSQAGSSSMIDRWLATADENHTRQNSTDDFLRYATMYGEAVSNDTEGSKAAQFLAELEADNLLDSAQKAEMVHVILGENASFTKKLTEAEQAGGTMAADLIHYYNVSQKYANDGDSETGKDEVLTDLFNDATKTPEEKRTLERILFNTEESKLHDYTSGAAFAVSGSKTQTEKLETAREQGFTDEQFLKYYDKKGDDLWQSLMLASDMTAAEKGAMQQIITGSDKTRDFGSVARYELSGMGAEKYEKALACMAGGIPDTTVLRYAKMDKTAGREALYADKLLTDEQKAFVEKTMYGVEEDKVRDYSSRAWYELSANDTRYKLAKNAEKSGVTPETALRYFELKATKTPNELGIDESIGKDEVRNTIAADGSQTTTQKQALDEMLFPNDTKRPDYTNSDWYYISSTSTAQYEKAKIAKAHGISEAVYAAEMREYYRMKDAKLGSGKNGAMKDKDSREIISKLGLTSEQGKTLWLIIKGKITE